jgi:hypothetical protein
VPRGTLGAEPAENEFTLAKNPFAERARGRFGNVVPLDILDIAATVTNEVVMAHPLGIESGGAPFDGHLTHQARLHEVTQIVIGSGPGTAWIQTIHSFEDFSRRGMPGLLHEECHHGVALRSAPQTAALQGLLYRISVDQTLDYI